MLPQGLSHEQLRILDPAVRVVEAGPGSGKTRSLVARFIETASRCPDGTGVALLSFTNAAVDEVRRRTSNAPQLLRSPHFVGTIDAFLHRFIVSPSEVARLGKLPSYWASWDDLPSDMRDVRIYQVKGAGIPLSRFRMAESGEVTLSDGELSWQEQSYLGQVESAGQRLALVNRAGSIIRGLNKKGVYDANSARVAAYHILEEPGGDAALGRLAQRFVEILVDEAQDCDAAEFAIVRQLAALTSTLVVADPDQAIFGFRGGDPELFSGYWNDRAPAERSNLTTNFRSSGSICSAINALRAVGVGVAAPSDTSACPPVYLLTGTLAEQRSKFLTILTEASLLPTQAMALAHRRADAAAFAGGTATAVAGGAGNRLAIHAGILRRPGVAATERMRALQHLEDLLLELLSWPDELRTAARADRLDTLGRSPEWLRVAVAGVLAQLAVATSRAQFGAIARTAIGQALHGLPFPAASLSSRVKKPSEDAWHLYAAEDQQQLQYDTIHGAKGAEFTAVVVCLPASLPKRNGTDVLEDWTSGTNSEARRVLYVGVSRAEHILAIAAGAHAPRIEELLSLSGTATEIR